ncbi:uncharacterized protein EAF01_001289 [Botrytis porri]|uniref:uncharacterized protein n=1 Tax=Botrytis porri TaxID=87229 RepID=UPI00190263B5|nr:uncharacterized protein EAF01_001289 [Botrytis porri]KAF7912268.1 hypothetical protein EAF01_001289 [Botrytis porri]
MQVQTPLAHGLSGMPAPTSMSRSGPSLEIFGISVVDAKRKVSPDDYLAECIRTPFVTIDPQYFCEAPDRKSLTSTVVMSNLSQCSNLAVHGSDIAGTNENPTSPNYSSSIPASTETSRSSSLYAYRMDRYLADSDHSVPYTSPFIIDDELSSTRNTELRKEAIAADLKRYIAEFRD